MNWELIDFEIDLINELFKNGEMTQGEYEDRVFKIFEKELEEEKKPMKTKTKVTLVLSKNNLERLNEYIAKNNIRFAPLMRDLVVKYLNEKGLK